jgi:hypothetical protein
VTSFGEAWRAGADAEIGYPAIKVKDIERGKANSLGAMQGLD